MHPPSVIRLIMLAALVVCGMRAFCVAAPAQQAPTTQRTLDEWVAQLGAENYADREEATLALLAMGPGIAVRLQELHDADTDAERRFRIRFLLENIIPPEQAILVLRADSPSTLKPGELITHVNDRRARNVADLNRSRGLTGRDLALRVTGAGGPRDLSRVSLDVPHVFANYRAPRGEPIARAVRLFNSGLAEQAHELLTALGPNVPEDELPPVLRARIAYTAGDGEAALALLKSRETVVRPEPTANQWLAPSPIDLCAEGRGPFALEWRLWTNHAEMQTGFGDPDLRVQRVLAPAARFVDALAIDAGLWTRLFREKLGTGRDETLTAGNMLAVSAWMLSELDLASECMRLIEPRSVVLRTSPQGARKWLRVRTDAWLPFLAGRPQEALDAFFDDAQDILQRPFDGAGRQVISNPRVAGWIAFFLYQLPQDARVNDTLALVTRAQHPAVGTYARAMLFAQTPANNEIIRQHFRPIVGVVPESSALWSRMSAAALEYAQKNPDDKWLAENVTALAESPPSPARDLYIAATTAMHQLTINKPGDALATLAPFDADALASTIRHTASFLNAPPRPAANDPALRHVIAAVPVGASDSGEFIIITRAHRLMRLAGEKLEPIEPPSDTWMAAACNFPWLGRDEKSGRVWCYDRRRVIELTRGASPAFRMSLKNEDILPFHRLIGPMFDEFAKCVVVGATLDPLTPDGISPANISNETGEFLRGDVRANREFVADPDIPELGTLYAIDAGARYWHAAARGGANFLIRAEAGAHSAAWTSVWMRDQLRLPRPPVFFPIRNPDADSPSLYLASDQGLIRLDTMGDRVTRIDLPGETPHAALVPENAPYQRTDRRWIYFARPPRDGGQVYRMTVENNRIETLDIRNEALSEAYYAVQSRAALRSEVGRAMRENAGVDLLAFISDATNVVNRWDQMRSAGEAK
ncbi:MAG: hypothetical protein JNG88_13305 [Phycisphaerales bacterium]|nr:hypothetical protein [Phycisphaerales bacterium]